MSEQACIPVEPRGSWMAGNLVTMPAAGASVALQSGQWWMASGPHRVSVLTGASLAVVWWSPSMRLGAVCHCACPQRPAEDAEAPPPRDVAHVVPEALDTVVRCLVDQGCAMDDLELTVVGGASAGADSLGADNVASALNWMADHGLRPRQMDVGGRVLRRLTVNLGDGSLSVAHGARLNPSEV
jgi:chemotaxis protein CheD